MAAYRNGIAFYLDKAAKLLEKKIHENAQLADSLQQELAQAMESELDAKKHRLSLMAAKLSALSPLTVLSRGYTITTAGAEPCNAYRMYQRETRSGRLWRMGRSLPSYQG